jgi:hypothetical protein
MAGVNDLSGQKWRHSHVMSTNMVDDLVASWSPDVKNMADDLVT